MSDLVRPTAQSFAIGEFRISTILDGTHIRTPLNPPFAMDKSDAELAAIGAVNRLPHDRFENGYTPTVIDTGTERVLVDVGFGAAGRDQGAGALRARLADVGYGPEDITIVALTHVHPDHILGLMEGDTLAFPNARHMIGRREFDEWSRGDLIPEGRAKNREMFLNIVAPLAERFTFLNDGDAAAPGVTAEAAFGHSVGHMMYRVESGGRQVLVWGDVCNHYVFSMQHPESPVGFDDDKEATITTRRRVLDMAATDDLLIAGHHMPFPSVGYVERMGDAFRWVPAGYQLWI